MLALALLEISGCHVANIVRYEIDDGYAHMFLEPQKEIYNPGRDHAVLIHKLIYLIMYKSIRIQYNRIQRQNHLHSVEGEPNIENKTAL